MKRKWFGVTEFEYEPVDPVVRRYVERGIALIRRATNWDVTKGGTRAGIEAALGRINELEQLLWVKVAT